jgi:hypothetical protein
MSGFAVAPQSQSDGGPRENQEDQGNTQVPWTGKQFKARHNKSATPSQAKSAARQATAMVNAGVDEGIAANAKGASTIVTDWQSAADATSLRAIAAGLNERNIPTARGGDWSATQVARLLEDIERHFDVAACAPEEIGPHFLGH